MPNAHLLSAALICCAIVSQAQDGWSTLNIPDAGRYDDICFVNDSVGWVAGGPSGWIRKTVNRGETWTLQYTSPGYLRSIEFINADTGFVGSLDGPVYRTNNGGATWVDISPSISPPPQGICGLSAPTSDVIYGCGVWSQPAYVIKSVNGGEDWTTIDMSAYATRLVDIFFTSPDTGFATGTGNPGNEGGIILYTTDGGATWTPKFMTNMISDIVWKIQKLDDVHWYASIYSDPINDDTRTLRSNDGGMTWTMIMVDDTYTYTEAVGFLNTQLGWTGGGGRLWETADGGDTWEEIFIGYEFNRFWRMNDSTAYLTGARVYKYEQELATGITPLPPRILLHRLSTTPNPTAGRITVTLTLDRRTMVDLNLLAANGATTQQLMHRKAEQGEYTFIVELEAAKGAAYFVVLRTNEGMQYEKVVVAGLD